MVMLTTAMLIMMLTMIAMAMTNNVGGDGVERDYGEDDDDDDDDDDDNDDDVDDDGDGGW